LFPSVVWFPLPQKQHHSHHGAWSAGAARPSAGCDRPSPDGALPGRFPPRRRTRVY
jgi:hypothetical protein